MTTTGPASILVRIVGILVFVLAYVLVRPAIAGEIGAAWLTVIDRLAPAALVLPAALWDRWFDEHRRTSRATGLGIAAVAAIPIVVQMVMSGTVLGIELMPQTELAANLIAFVIAIYVAGSSFIQRPAHRAGAYKRAERATFGSGQLATSEHIKELLSCKVGIPLGVWKPSGEILRWDRQGTVLTVAPSRAGKGLSSVVPACIEWPGGMVVLDPKGQNFAIAAVARELLGHQVAVLNPFDIPAVDVVGAQWNPFDLIEGADGPNFQEAVENIADAIVVHDDTDKTHFHDTAKVMIAGVIAFVAVDKKGTERNLRSVYEMFMAPPATFNQWADKMIMSADLAAGLPQKAGSVWARTAKEERGSIYSTCVRQVSFLSNRRMQHFFARSTFSMAAVASGQVDVFACLPSDTSSQYHRFYRLVVGSAIAAMVRARTKPKCDVLFLLDEMSVLGRMDRLLNREGAGAVTWGGDYGIKVWGILQSPAQLEAAYGRDGAKIWRSNLAVLQVFGVSKADKETSEEIAALLGETTIEVRSQSRSVGSNTRGLELLGGASSGLNQSLSDQRRLVVTADELRRLPQSAVILLMRDVEFPVRADRMRYFERPEWAWRFGMNPYFDGHQANAIDVRPRHPPAPGASPAGAAEDTSAAGGASR